MKKWKLFSLSLCLLLFFSAFFPAATQAEWIKEEGSETYRYQLDNGSMAASQWITWEGNRYYIMDDGLMAANRSLSIDGICYAFYSDGRVMHKDDITDVELGYLNLYSTADTLASVSSKWADYSIELPGNTIFLDYRSLAGRKPVYEFLASVPSSGTRPLTVSSCYFQMAGILENSIQEIAGQLEEEGFTVLSSSSVTMGNDVDYKMLTFVYDLDGLYGRPLYRDCYIRKIGDFCHILTFEYESIGKSLAKRLQDCIAPYKG
ncbi:hypothetical protein AALB16_15950 [Lachnospiraceae bacterium 62-35]